MRTFILIASVVLHLWETWYKYVLCVDHGQSTLKIQIRQAVLHSFLFSLVVGSIYAFSKTEIDLNIF
jgi:hypothetical protein